MNLDQIPETTSEHPTEVRLANDTIDGISEIPDIDLSFYVPTEK